MTTTQHIPWPADVRATDWTEPSMAGPPAEPTRIGYRRWWDDQDGACGVDYYVNPDGSADVVRFTHHNPEDESQRTAVETMPAGGWAVEYPVGVTFGSRGGCWVRSL